MKTKFPWIITLLIIVVCAGIYGLYIHIPPGPPIEVNSFDGDSLIKKNEDALRFATHIADAELKKKKGNEYLFQIKKIIKGSFDENEKEIWIKGEHLPEEQIKKGETYLLILERIVSVYEDNGGFWTYIAPSFVKENDDEWKTLHDKAEKMVQEGSGEKEPFIGTRCIMSDDLNEVIDFSTYIFKIKPQTIVYDNPNEKSGRKAYSCRILSIMKGTPSYKGDIITSFYDNTVELGKEYIVLLECADGDSKVFPLSSRNKSVFSLEDAAGIPELNKLIQSEKPTEYEEQTSGYLDDLKEEWKWAVEHGVYKEFYYSYNSECVLFFNKRLYEIEGSGKVYNALLNRIADFGRCVMVNENTFLLENDKSGVQVTINGNSILLSINDGEITEELTLKE